MNYIKYLDTTIFMLATSLFIFFQNMLMFVTIIIIILFIRIFISFRNQEGIVIKGIAFISIIGNILLVMWQSYSVMTISILITAIGSLIRIFYDIRTYRPQKTNRIQKLIALPGYMFLILLLVILMGLTYNAFNPDTLTRASQDIIAGKVTGKTQKLESNDGTMYYKNIVYEQHQDNTVLDIYTSPEPKGTLFYIHGGGYAFDDKTYREQYLYQFVKQGYNVVNINYTLSPDAHYPDTLVQANQALSYVIKHAETYGIDPSKMIFSGDSVGAQVSGQLVLLLTNQSYAKELGIVPANVDNDIEAKGFISVSGLLDTPEVGNTRLFATDWLFETLIRSYFQTNDVAHSEEVMESSILENVNKQFPPTFMSDGNFGSFTKQAQALHHKLTQLGVDSQLVLFDRSEAPLFHVFELKVENPYAQKVHEAQLDFMASVLEQ